MTCNIKLKLEDTHLDLSSLGMPYISAFPYWKITKRFFNGILLRCLNEDEAMHAIEEVHSGVCSAH